MMTLPPRKRVSRSDGRVTHVVQKRGHLSYCFHGCCCGRTDRGFQESPSAAYTREWKRRKLRHHIHLTKAGCLGPCALNNVAHLVIEGHHHWFHSVNDEWIVEHIFDYIERVLQDGYQGLPPELLEYSFDYYAWSEQAPVAMSTPEKPEVLEGIVLLSHADTDLLHLRAAKENLPPDFGNVTGIALGSLRDESQITALLEGVVGRAEIIVIRIHGSIRSVVGLHQILQYAREAGQHVLLLSGTGEYDPELNRLSLASVSVLEQAQAYLLASGWQNIQELLFFLSDTLRNTEYGSLPPLLLPEYGIYHPSLPEHATLDDWQRLRTGRPVIAILFYRAHALSGHTEWIDTLIHALDDVGADALPLFTTSLKDTDETGTPRVFSLLQEANVVISTLSFALTDASGNQTVLQQLGIPFVQGMVLGQSQRVWSKSQRGLNPLDTAMNVALPEFDGRIITVPFAFKEQEEDVRKLVADPERSQRLATISVKLARLGWLPNHQKRIALILTNSTAKAAQIGNAVGLDSAASLLGILQALQQDGYQVGDLPDSSDQLIHEIIAQGHHDPAVALPAEWQGIRIPVATYQAWFAELPLEEQQRMVNQWGEPPGEAFVLGDHICIAGLLFGNCFVALQPPRGYGFDPDAIYHTPDLVPTHQYYALYRWLREPLEIGGFSADALIHLGKHGTLEWLPGKGIGLSRHCFPDQFLGDLPLFYPFVINDPGEGTQSKRRAHATIIDHLPPPLTRADTYGPLAELARLVDEYYQLELLDPAKLPLLQAQIWKLIEQTDLGTDLPQLLSKNHGDHVHEWDATETDEGIPLTLAEMNGADVAHLLEDLDGYLCELGAAQIRDGLHTLGKPPQDLPEMLRALTRLDNAAAGGIHRLLAHALDLNYTELLDDAGKRMIFSDELHQLAGQPLLTAGDALELIDELSLHLYQLLDERNYDAAYIPEIIALTGISSSIQLQETLQYALHLREQLLRTTDEIDHLLQGLCGRAVPAGPSGTPSRGQAHILPTGRNFYSVDPRSMPSMAAWSVGQQLAGEVLNKWHTEEHCYPEHVAISVWGTSNMRTGGDDIAEIFALLGVRPCWHAQSKRIESLELIPLAELNRPRIDVTVRISGFFRDAFPHLIRLLSEAFDLVMHADEDPEMNYPRKHFLQDKEQYEDEIRATYRIFSNPPGGYGTGLLEMINAGNWQNDQDFAHSFIQWGGYAYTADAQGIDAREEFRQRLGLTQLVLHNQDNREHDILDSDDYFQFFGGMIASVRHVSGMQPKNYFGDTSRPERAKVRHLSEEALRVYRSRVVNPKWLSSIRKHGYKGGLEQAATLDYLFGFDATAGIMHDFMYEGIAQAYALNQENQTFLQQSNPWALGTIVQRLLEAESRGLWNAKDETKESLENLLLDYERWQESHDE